MRLSKYGLSLLAIIGAVLCGVPQLVTAADAEFVGRLAVAVDPDVAAELGLTEATREKLLELIDERESEALDLVLEMKDLSEAEQQAKLAPFVAESERLGFELLSPAEQGKLAKIAIREQGLEGLNDPAIADELVLSVGQRKEIAGLFVEKARAMTVGGEDDRRAAAAAYDRKIFAVLGDSQRTAWEKMSGMVGEDELAAGDPEAMPIEPEDGAPDDGEPSDGEPMTEEIGPQDDPDGVGKPKTEVEEPADPKTADPKSDSPKTGEPKTGDNVPLPPQPMKVDPVNRDLKDIKLKFSFRYAPWKDVLDWFAEEAGLSLLLPGEAPPTGTFNYTDGRSYSPAEAIDLLNSALLVKGFTLVRRDRMLILIDLEEGVPPDLIPQVSPEKLDEKGEFELVSVLFQLSKMTPEEAEEEVNKLLGLQGSIVVLSKAKQIYVTDTAGKLRTIQKVIDAIENPETREMQLVVISLEHTSPEEVMLVARQLMGIANDSWAMDDGSLRVAADGLLPRMMVSGKAAALERFKEIVELVDVPGQEFGGATVIETPQLQIYSVTTADPEAVLQVFQTLLAGLPDVRLATDPKTGNLVALARPSQHATIQATLDEMQRDKRQVEVFQLIALDPQVAVLSINKLFGMDGEEPSPNSPIIDADPSTGKLMIRATEAQITSIKELLEKLGETGEDYALTEDRGNVRLIPLTGREADEVLDQLEFIWPTVRQNKIRVVTPSSARKVETEVPEIPEIQEGRGTIRRQDDVPLDELKNLQPQAPEKATEKPTEKPGAKPADKPKPDAEAQHDKGASPVGTSAGITRYASFLQVTEDATEAEQPATSQPATSQPPETQPKPVKPKQTVFPEVLITRGPGGIILASEDKEALDEMESLLASLQERTTTSTQYTVFYLKYAKADVASSLLQEALGAGGADAGGGGGGSLLGDMASSMLGDVGGGLMGGLLGLGGDSGGGGLGTGAMTIIPDLRLNALLVQAADADLDTIEQLLEVIDQASSPEPQQTQPSPRLIPILYTSVDDVATTVREVYAARISGGDSARGNRQPSPEDLIRALRGGGRGGGGGADNRGEAEKMTIGVDKRSNSLVVSAPDWLFEDVVKLVEKLDMPVVDSNEAINIITLKRTNPELMQKALESIVGDAVTTSTSTSNTASSNSNSSGNSGNNNNNEDAMRQRMEFINNLRRLQEAGGGGGRGGPPGGGRGGPPGGGRGGPAGGGGR